jgi:polysaccharide biosynthesis PFTS motif protein
MKGLKNQIFKLNMIWYSQNFIPKAYVGETNRPDLPSARHMRVDKHWVWTNGFKDYLQELGQSSEILVVGPLLWHLDSLDNIYKRDEYISIAIFDINPLPDGNNPFGAIKNYYSTSLMKKFIIDILDLKEEIENITGGKVKFYLIPKKDYHDIIYFSFLSDLLNTRKDLEFVNSNENLFQLIKKTDFSIAVPYTSTCYVGSHCKKNAIYYDPFGELIPFYEKNEYVDFASGQNQLLGIVKRLVINYKSVK